MHIEGKVVVVFAWIMFCLPAPALIWTWWKQFSQPIDRFGWFSRLLLIGTTASYLLFLISGVDSLFLGPYYSDRRYTTIKINIAANALIAFFAAVWLGPLRRRVCVAGPAIAVAFVWFLVLGVNMAV